MATRRYHCKHDSCEVGGWVSHANTWAEAQLCPLCHRTGSLESFSDCEIMKSEDIPVTQICKVDTDWSKVNTLWDAFAL